MRHSMTRATENLQDTPAAGNPSRQRRLTDAVIKAFDEACTEGDLEVAAQLVDILDAVLARRSGGPGGIERRRLETAHALHKRLWHLKHGTPPEA
jgi:hypothetical protein